MILRCGILNPRPVPRTGPETDPAETIDASRPAVARNRLADKAASVSAETGKRLYPYTVLYLTATFRECQADQGDPGTSIHQTEAAIMDKEQQQKIESAAFRRLIEHLQQHTEVQNIDLMNLAGFCRNCLAKWYRAAAEEQDLSLTDAEAREHIYGMPYETWKERYQKPAPADRSPQEQGKD